MNESRVDRLTRGFFWFGYVVFLAASIPHTAAYFRHFDPVMDGWENIAAWCVAILIAVVIDVSDVLVSIAVMKEMARGTRKRDLLGYWAFIVFIMLLSWFFNWQYNIVYGTTTFAKADTVNLLGLVTVGQINPVVGSAFHVLLLIYTGMAHKFTHHPPEKTVAQLKEEAEELEQKATYIKRIQAIKQQQQESAIGSMFTTLRKVKEEATRTVFKSSDEADKVQFTHEFLAVNPEATDEELANYLGLKQASQARSWRLKAQMSYEQDAIRSETVGEPETSPMMEELPPEDERQGGSSDGTQKPPSNVPSEEEMRKSRRRKPMSVAEVATLLGCSQRHVRDLRSQGNLTPCSTNPKLIEATSVKRYLEHRKTRRMTQTSRTSSQTTTS